MALDINAILSDMADAVKQTVADDVEKVGAYAERILAKEKISLEELAMAKLTGEITDQEFDEEVEREKMVIQAELLTLRIMTKAAAQKVVNAVMAVFVKAVKLAV